MPTDMKSNAAIKCVRRRSFEVGTKPSKFGFSVIKSSQAGTLLGLLITGVTVVLSWSFTHILFTLHYANVYYRPHEHGTPGGLDFPGERPPDYRDFLYYAFVIGCATQTGDVNTTSREMRLITLAHGVVAFAFNTAILALMINVSASLL